MENFDKFMVVATVIVSLIMVIKAEDYEYGNQASWYDKYEQCRMNHQSPIELNSADAVLSYDIPALNFRYYDTPFILPAMTENNGHTANILIPKPKGYTPELWQRYDRISPHITGGQLPHGRFVAESVHFHWGSKDAHGSEHVINSERYSMEMHIVHRNSKYRMVEEARNHADGLAVLAVLYNVKPNVSEFAGLQNIVNSLKSISEWNQTIELKNFSLSALFGNLDISEFYTYQGSLTTPPCSEAVTWSVFTHDIPIAHTQMNEFHKLSDGHHFKLENNYRSLQAKGNRKVYLRNKRKIIDSVVESQMFWELYESLRPQVLNQEKVNTGGTHMELV